MGGFGPSGLLPMNEVYLFDTINNLWDTKTTDGNIPTERAAFSAVLGLDGQSVIIFGGDSAIPLVEKLYVLDGVGGWKLYGRNFWYGIRARK
ncbi:unnamed protein product [Rhizophagus irregularis]|nr:unnamed protein product [Rhizophagus irregularis]